MKELLQNENIRKCIKLFAVSLGVILVIKYLLPLFWPFVLVFFRRVSVQTIRFFE